jgi:predicted nuclease of predicted toxin-antitoxin system
LTLKFKVDENMPVEVAALLAQAGHDALTVADQQLGGHSDPDVADVCQRESRVIVTLDLDFANIRTYPPADYAGIVVLRLARLDKRRVLSAVQRLLPTLDQEPLAGKLWIVDETTVRIRS